MLGSSSDAVPPSASVLDWGVVSKQTAMTAAAMTSSTAAHRAGFL